MSLIKNIVYVIAIPKMYIISENSIKSKCVTTYRYWQTCSSRIVTVQNSLHNKTHDMFGQMPKIRRQISITWLTVCFIFIFLLLLLISYCFALLTCIDSDKKILNDIMKNIWLIARCSQYNISVHTGSLKESASGRHPPTSRRSLNILIAQIACTIVDKKNFQVADSLPLKFSCETLV